MEQLARLEVRDAAGSSASGSAQLQQAHVTFAAPHVLLGPSTVDHGVGSLEQPMRLAGKPGPQLGIPRSLTPSTHQHSAWPTVAPAAIPAASGSHGHTQLMSSNHSALPVPTPEVLELRGALAAAQQVIRRLGCELVMLQQAQPQQAHRTPMAGQPNSSSWQASEEHHANSVTEPDSVGAPSPCSPSAHDALTPGLAQFSAEQQSQQQEQLVSLLAVAEQVIDRLGVLEGAATIARREHDQPHTGGEGSALRGSSPARAARLQHAAAVRQGQRQGAEADSGRGSDPAGSSVLQTGFEAAGSAGSDPGAGHYRSTARGAVPGVRQRPARGTAPVLPDRAQQGEAAAATQPRSQVPVPLHPHAGLQLRAGSGLAAAPEASEQLQDAGGSRGGFATPPHAAAGSGCSSSSTSGGAPGGGALCQPPLSLEDSFAFAPAGRIVDQGRGAPAATSLPCAAHDDGPPAPDNVLSRAARFAGVLV
jgi:hypothetical protein